MYTITKYRLRKEVDYAFRLARKHKSNKLYVKQFEENLNENIDILTELLFNREYLPSPSFCFIINEPKLREIFASKFIDRIVHHVYYNMVVKMFDSLLIEDSYSCRVGKGTHYGVRRLYKKVQQASGNYRKEIYSLLLDIKGYFISINRQILLNITERIFDKMQYRKAAGYKNGILYDDIIDFDFIKYLNRVIILNNPSENCIIKSPLKAWIGLPDSKSLFKSAKNCGLPIGNLTSQLLSNLYLNELDLYIKRELHCKYYGRYVDDLYILSENKLYLKDMIPKIKNFLLEKLQLELNDGKTKISKVSHGIQFLGYYVKYYRTYLSNKTLTRMLKNINTKLLSINGINSYLGMFRHCASYRLRKEIFRNRFRDKGWYNDDYTKFIPYNNIKC